MTEEKAIEEIMRVRSQGSGNATIYSFLCGLCKQPTWTYRTNVTYCGYSCASKVKKKSIGPGKLNPRWKGGKSLDGNGYVRLSGNWGHPRAHKTNGRVLEHILVMEKHLGRPVGRYESIYYKNGIRSDNRIENLELWVNRGGQPYGQRISDLVRFVVDNYPFEVRTLLECADAAKAAVLTGKDSV